jgi:hypothetical protein
MISLRKSITTRLCLKIELQEKQEQPQNSNKRMILNISVLASYIDLAHRCCIYCTLASWALFHWGSGLIAKTRAVNAPVLCYSSFFFHFCPPSFSYFCPSLTSIDLFDSLSEIRNFNTRGFPCFSTRIFFRMRY